MAGIFSGEGPGAPSQGGRRLDGRRTRTAPSTPVRFNAQRRAHEELDAPTATCIVLNSKCGLVENSLFIHY